MRLTSCMEYSRALTRRERDPRQVPSSLFVLSHARSAGVGVGVHSRGSGGASRRCGRGRTTLGCQRRRWASCRVQRHRCDPPTPLCPFQLYCERRLGYIKLHRWAMIPSVTSHASTPAPRAAKLSPHSGKLPKEQRSTRLWWRPFLLGSTPQQLDSAHSRSARRLSHHPTAA